MYDDEGEGDDGYDDEAELAMQQEQDLEREREQEQEQGPHQPQIPSQAEHHLQESTHVAAARAVVSLHQQMDAAGLEPAARRRLEDYARLSRRALELHLPPSGVQALQGLPFCPSQGAGNPHQPPPPRSVATTEWSRDSFPTGSMRFVNRLAALRLMASAHVAGQRLSSVEGADEVEAMVRQLHSERVNPSTVRIVAVTAEMHLPDWQQQVTVYASATVPRTLERTPSPLAAYGIQLSNVLRARSSFFPD